MKVMVEGCVTAWCYVDTDSGEVELVEVWAWDEELQFAAKPYVIAERADQDKEVTSVVRRQAAEAAAERATDAVMTVARTPSSTRLG